MDVLKGIPFSIALIVVGAVFILSGLSGNLPVGSGSVVIQDLWSRGLVCVLGAALVGLAIYIEVSVRVRPKGTLSVDPDEKESKQLPILKLAADAFFYTLDDERSDSFPTLVKDAKRISILGRTAVNLVSQYQRVLEQVGKSGCEIRLLVVDPLSEAARFLYGSFPEVYWSNFRMASSHLIQLKQKLGGRFQLKTTKHAPTLSLIVAEKQDVSCGVMRVQLYFLHSRVGRDRPIFHVDYCDKWYDVFMEEFNELWLQGDDMTDDHLATFSGGAQSDRKL